MIRLEYDPQDPTAVIDYEIDFADEILENSPLTLASLDWAVAAIAGDLAPLSIVAQSNASDFSSTVVRVTGGTIGLSYRMRCSRVWSDGERDVVSFTLPIAYT